MLCRSRSLQVLEPSGPGRSGRRHDPLAGAQAPNLGMFDPKLIRRLARIMSGEGLTELEIDDKESGLELKLKRGDEAQAQVSAPVLQVMPGGVPAAAPVAIPPAGGVVPAEPGGLPPGTTTLDSPMVGTFYRSPSPDTDPFIEVGARFDGEKVVCIVEAMKVMNEIKAEMRGEIVEILVSDGEPVEFGQPLFLVKQG